MENKQDPWAVADEAKPRPFVYFGEAYSDAYFCTFEPTGDKKPNGKDKMRKVPFDAARHDPAKRQSAGLRRR